MTQYRRKIDYASEQYFDKKRAMVYIEHTDSCPVFKEKAFEFILYLKRRYPAWNFHLQRNVGGNAREGSFEIRFSQNARTPIVLLWSGIDKGPPRREKFPIPFDILAPEIDSILKRIYVDLDEQKKSQEKLMSESENEQPAEN